MSTKSNAEQLLLTDLVAAGWSPKAGHAFHETRAWEFDLAWPAQKLAVEVDGRGRHQTAKGERGDCEKLNAALEDGWRVLRYPAASVATAKRRARIVEQVARILCGVSDPEEAACVLVGE
jgi:hypothetical protein